MSSTEPNVNPQIVYLIDDDEAVRSALSLLLETLGLQVAAFADPENFLATVASLEPGCIVLDIRMPHISGLRLQQMLFDNGCDWPVIVISGHGDIEACRKAFKHGAIDFLSKPIDEQDLIDAVQKGHTQLEKANVLAAERKEAKILLAHLSAREKEILDLITRGLTSRDIAQLLELSPRTVESHRAHIIEKLGTGAVVEMRQIVLSAR